MKPTGDIAGAVILGIIFVLFVVAFVALAKHIDKKYNVQQSMNLYARLREKSWLYRQDFIDVKHVPNEHINLTYLTTKGIFATVGTIVGAVVCAGGAVFLGTRKPAVPAPE